MNAEKYELGVTKLNFLGHKVTTSGISPMPDRVEDIRSFPKPGDKPGLQRFLGMINFYHRFMPTIARKLIPLHKAVGECKTKTGKVIWNEDRDAAFEEAKTTLAEATLLHHPLAEAEIKLTVDASDVAMGGQIEQKLAERFEPIAFFSKKLSEAETSTQHSIVNFSLYILRFIISNTAWKEDISPFGPTISH